MKASLAALRRYAVSRSLTPAVTLAGAIERLDFVQADPIRAPARAQDLTLRHRVRGYRAGDLEQAYPRLAIEEDYFVNYGFVSRRLHALMHPRVERRPWTRAERKKVDGLLEFVREHGVVHPRQVEAHFSHGTTTNWFGGRSNVTTRLLDGMHYRGLLRVARREGGIRLYCERTPTPPPDDAEAAQQALIDVIVRKYAPLPAATLGQLVFFLGGGAPQWHGRRKAALARALERLSHAEVDGVDWYWPADERLDGQPAREVRLLAPFDPIVWCRRRFELFWGWAYRFEAYTPRRQRKLGYYALPMLWRDRVIGWGNVSVADGELVVDAGYVSGSAPREAGFRRELEAEHERLRAFLSI